MAVTEITLLILAALATLGTLGLFADYADRWTELLVTFTTALLWAIFGFSSFDVMVRNTAFATASEPIMPLVFVGFGFSAVVFMYGFYDLVAGVASEASEAADNSLF